MAEGARLPGVQDDLLRPKFRMDYQGDLRDQGQLSVADNESDILTDDTAPGFTSLSQYEASVLFPVYQRGVNLDLGVNIKYLDGQVAWGGDDRRITNFSAAIPMFQASALFDLPFQGLSASISGSHINYERTFATDYKAKLSYEWENGIGLEGGWQHQQFSLGGGEDDVTTSFEQKGPFLDFRYRF